MLRISVIESAEDAATLHLEGQITGLWIAELRDADGCISYSMSRELLDQAPKLSWIQAGSAGIDHFFKSSDIKLDDLVRRRIRLTKAAGVTRYVIGDHVFAMILAVSRNVPRAVHQQAQRVWQIYMGTELHGDRHVV